MQAVHEIRITALVENQADMLLTDSPGVRRFGLMQHFSPPHGEPVRSENGISFWIEVDGDGRTRRVVHDTSLTAGTVLHNLSALGIDLDSADHFVLSHAHPDHFGGLAGVVGARTAPTPVAVHPDAFLAKWIVDEAGTKVYEVTRPFDRRALEDAGAEIVETPDPVEVVPGITVTGGIPRDHVPFEPPVPPRKAAEGICIERDGELINDDAAIDEQALVMKLGDRGIVVISSCGHAGMINTIRYAQELAETETVVAVLGGFHFGFPGVPPENLDKTINELRSIGPAIIAPMHCTGMRGQAALYQAFPDRFLHNVVGTTLTLSASK